MKNFSLFLLSITLLFTGCSNLNKSDKAGGVAVDFGNLKSMNASDLISDYSYVALESSENSLFGQISQVEIYNDKIYILDSGNTNALYVFTIDGKYVRKLKGIGDGPGEFISPHSFWIDNNGFILILDRQLNRLQKYRLDDLKFVDAINLPAPAPLSFASVPNQDLYVYYYPLREKSLFAEHQVIVSDGAGNVVHQLHEASPSGKILHGSSTNFYLFDDCIRTYPYFSNEIYELNTDSLHCCYSFSWGDLTFPPADLFVQSNNSGTVMKEVLRGENDWIRLLYAYETEKRLAVKYYIKSDFYLSIWNKEENQTVNVKSENISDDLGFGGKFPLPISTHDDQFIGVLYPFDVATDGAIDERLVNLLSDTPEDSNPILAFYDLK